MLLSQMTTVQTSYGQESVPGFEPWENELSELEKIKVSHRFGLNRVLYTCSGNSLATLVDL